MKQGLSEAALAKSCCSGMQLIPQVETQKLPCSEWTLNVTDRSLEMCHSVQTASFDYFVILAGNAFSYPAWDL